jgi:hypothetical protein
VEVDTLSSDKDSVGVSNDVPDDDADLAVELIAELGRTVVDAHKVTGLH